MKNLSELLEQQANNIPNKIYLSNLNDSYSFSEFNILVNKCCNFFIKIGITDKDVISICLTNRLEFLILYFASIRFGSIFFLISTNDTIPQIETKMKNVKSNIIFNDNSLKFTSINNKFKSFFIDNKFIDELKLFNSIQF